MIRKQETCENGEKVVAMVDKAMTLKKYYKKKDQIRLEPMNSTMEPIVVDPSPPGRPDPRRAGRRHPQVLSRTGCGFPGGPAGVSSPRPGGRTPCGRIGFCTRSSWSSSPGCSPCRTSGGPACRGHRPRVNAECTREMCEASTWVVPTFNWDLRTAKPILTYWIQRPAFELFGVSEWSARLPSPPSSASARCCSFMASVGGC